MATTGGPSLDQLWDIDQTLDQFLDQHGVAIVSVTQAFSSTNSMGQLTLNILMSFAQFERQMIAERTRDKMAATRRRGLYLDFLPWSTDLGPHRWSRDLGPPIHPAN